MRVYEIHLLIKEKLQEIFKTKINTFTKINLHLQLHYKSKICLTGISLKQCCGIKLNDSSPIDIEIISDPYFWSFRYS